MARLVGCAIAGLGLGALARPAMAQISPGRLSRGHARLEGSAHCLDCHDARKGAAPERCRSCHTALASSPRGLHARPEYADCRTCHVEHQGVDVDLVWWGKAGRAAFDHGATGFPLAGRHAPLACASCHQPRLVKEPERLRGGGADPGRTFLGLQRDCAACHADPHRGTAIGGRECAACHTPRGWKPAGSFDHARTSFALSGRHAVVACTACHSLRPGEPARVRPAAAAGPRTCASCHDDPHQARLGSSCSSCHSTATWHRVEQARFDHGKTGYPLEGRHAAVGCGGCHRGGRPPRPAHAACTDCHADTHLGQLAEASGRTQCERCHDVAGFMPARFPIERHQASRFALQGAHLTVACDRCHRRLSPLELGRKVPALRLADSRAVRATAQFRFAATGCEDCHGDPHRGELDGRRRSAGCVSCHDVRSWRAAFDHSSTRFALTGPHARATCDKCHAPAPGAARGARLKLGGLATACESCHRDPHQGQFAAPAGAGAARACTACHTGDELKAAGFDHRRDASFPLQGAHARAACSGCHRREKRGTVEFTRYRPLPRACADCHAAEPSARAGP